MTVTFVMLARLPEGHLDAFDAYEVLFFRCSPSTVAVWNDACAAWTTGSRFIS